MLVPYSDNLNSGWFFRGVLLLCAVMLALDVPAFVDHGVAEWQVRNLAFFPILFSVSPWARIYTLGTAVFLHGSVLHLFGNCLFLWVFGRSLERLFGLPLFVGLFPLLGSVGLLVHWSLYPASQAPVIGASGAIATLMGAYLALFPSAKMKMLLFLGLPIRFQVPAWAFLFYWIGLQLLSLAFGSSESDGVAYAVHFGGFVAGAMAAIIWKVSYPSAEEKLEAFTRGAFRPV